MKISRTRTCALLVISLTMLAGMHAYFRTVIIPAQEVSAAANHQPRGNLSDLYPRWLGTRELFLEHRNPYSAEVTADIQRGYWGRTVDPNNADDPKDEMRFAYPLYVVFLLAPTITLPFETVQRLYLSIAIPLSVLSVWLWMRTLGDQAGKTHVAVAAVLFLGSYPVVQAIHLQHLALLIFAVITFAVAALSSSMFAAAGIVLAIAMIKPQSTLPIAGWFLFWALAGWKERKMLIISFAATMILLCTGASLLLPGWVAEWRDAASSYMGYTADVPAHVQVVFGRYAGALIGLALCVGMAILCWKTRHDRASSDRFKLVSASILVVNLAVTPLWHEYDQMFVLPAILLMFEWRHEWHRLHPLAQAIVSVSGIALLWHWIAAILLVVMTHIVSDIPPGWQIFPWLPLFFAPTLVLVSLTLIARQKMRFFPE